MRGCKGKSNFRVAALFPGSRQNLTKFQPNPLAGRAISCGHRVVAWWGGRLHRILVWDRAVAVGAGHIEDDGGAFGIFLLGDCRQDTEELVRDVGEDGGAAGGDFVLGEEEEQAREEVVDLSGGGKVVEIDGEGGGDFRGV